MLEEDARKFNTTWNVSDINDLSEFSFVKEILYGFK